MNNVIGNSLILQRTNTFWEYSCGNTSMLLEYPSLSRDIVEHSEEYLNIRNALRRKCDSYVNHIFHTYKRCPHRIQHHAPTYRYFIVTTDVSNGTS